MKLISLSKALGISSWQKLPERCGVKHSEPEYIRQCLLCSKWRAYWCFLIRKITYAYFKNRSPWNRSKNHLTSLLNGDNSSHFYIYPSWFFFSMHTFLQTTGSYHSCGFVTCFIFSRTIWKTHLILASNQEMGEGSSLGEDSKESLLYLYF